MKNVVIASICVVGFCGMTTPALAGYTLIQGANTWTIDPVQESGQTATQFYSYGSPYTWSGDNPNFEHQVSKLYLYGDPDGTVNLVMHHSMRNNIDKSGVWIPVKFDFSDLPTGTTVALADDSGEMDLNGGTWRFRKNSDGGILANLSASTNWCLTVSPNFFLDSDGPTMDTWKYVNADGNTINLDRDKDVQICYSAPTVPVPGAFLLSSMGALGVGWFRKRRLG